MIRRPPRSTLDRSSAASDVYKRQHQLNEVKAGKVPGLAGFRFATESEIVEHFGSPPGLSLIHISEPTRPYSISYAVFCLKTKNRHNYNDSLPMSILMNTNTTSNNTTIYTY